jgi:hypothetical protein
LAGVNVGPALADQDLGTVGVTISFADVTLKGKVVNCSGSPVDSGSVTALIDGLNYSALVKKGVFTLPVSRCFSNSVQIRLTAVDYSSLQQGSPTTITASTGDADAGVLSACGISIDQFINLTYRGVDYNFIIPPDSIQYMTRTGNDSVTFIAWRPAGAAKDESFLLAVRDNLLTPGEYPIPLASFYADANRGAFGNDGTITITAAGPVGGYITGTFAGNLRDSTGAYPVTGQLRVKRTE